MLHFIVQHLSRMSKHNQKHISHGNTTKPSEFYLQSLLTFLFLNEKVCICYLLLNNSKAIILLTVHLME